MGCWHWPATTTLLGRAPLATRYSPDRQRFSVSAVAAWQQRGNKRIGQILRVVKTETCPGLLRNSVRRLEGKLPHIGIDILLLWAISAPLARALHPFGSSLNFFSPSEEINDG